MSEQSPLVQNHVPCPNFKRLKYRLTRIRSRAAVLVLLWDLIFQSYKIFMFNFTFVVGDMLTLHVGVINVLSRSIFYIPFLFYPVGGLIADVWIG